MYAPGALDYLDRAIRQWGKNHNVLVLISMHGGKGSQNGQDHSGPENPGHAYWAQYPENVRTTLDSVEFLAKRYKDEPAFLGQNSSLKNYIIVGIGLLNEPTDQDINVLKQYYYDAYGRIRNDLGSDMLLTVSPLLSQQSQLPQEPTFFFSGSNTPGNWEHFMNPPFYNIRHEWHPYFVWGYEGKSADQVDNFYIQNNKILDHPSCRQLQESNTVLVR